MKTSILIVEDEGLIALDLKNRLEESGYFVPMISDNAADALLSVERLRPSLVTMDIRLQGPRDGIATAAEISQRFHIPVIFVSALADRATLERARVTEPFGFIVKPFMNVDFRAQIEMALWKHKIEEKLRTSEAWLAVTFRNVADALIATDGEGNVNFMNPNAATLTGWSSDEAKGKPLLEVFHVFEESTGLPMAHPVNMIYNGQEIARGARNLKLVRRNSSDTTIVEAQITPNRDGESLLGIIIVFRDITERRKAEEQHRQLQKVNALALMSAGLGRELAESQKLIDDSLGELIADSPEGRTMRLLETIHRHAAYQQGIIQQLGKLGNANAGNTVPVDVNSIITDMASTMHKALGRSRFLHFKLQPDLECINVDPQDLRDNLLRLISSARQAMPDGGLVEVSTSSISSVKFPRGIQVVIRDSGKEIHAIGKSRVFDPYYQSRPGKARSGLSLALVYQFVAQSGGAIEAEAAAAGEGAEYLLSFPAAELSDLATQSQRKLTAHT